MKSKRSRCIAPRFPCSTAGCRRHYGLRPRRDSALMVIDTSVMLAILQNEPERSIFREALENADSCCMSAASFVESSMIIESRYGADGVRDLDLLIAKALIALEAVDVEQAHHARRAFRQYGKGRHPAGLNFGDCFSYASPARAPSRFYSRAPIFLCPTSSAIPRVADRQPRAAPRSPATPWWLLGRASHPPPRTAWHATTHWRRPPDRAGSALSASLWLKPPAQGTNTMAVGTTADTLQES